MRLSSVKRLEYWSNVMQILSFGFNACLPAYVPNVSALPTAPGNFVRLPQI